MKKLVLLFCIVNLLSTFTYSYNNLYIQDPRGWRSSQGSIDEASLVVTPAGLYIQYELYLTFSSKTTYGNQFTHADSLEIILNFDLPEGAIVDDLWLWVGDYISKAFILDKWTASAIYENIVKRRRDPAILTKTSNYSYELRIYPMAGDESRKIKITYMLPVKWNSNSVTAEIPSGILLTSSIPVENLSLTFNANEEWKNPRIEGHPEIVFAKVSQSSGDVLEANIPKELITSMSGLEMDSPMKDGIYLGRYNTTEGGLFQLSLIPGKAFDLKANRKFILLVDYETSKSNISKEALLSELENELKINLTPTDSFNIVIAGLDVSIASDSWIPGDSLSIVAAFDSIGQLSEYGNLPSLLNKGIEFLNSNGNIGHIILVTNSEGIGGYQEANALLDDLKEKMNELYTVSVLDYLQNPTQWLYINNRSYVGNEYFLENLSRITKGDYVNTRYSADFSAQLLVLLQSAYGYISSFDFYTTLQNGYCFSRLSPDNSSMVYLNKPITQIGKFSGDFPFIINSSGIFNSETFSKNIVVDESNTYASDTLTSKMWAGLYIKLLEQETQTNSIINEIIDYSISERILSLYSAFLALEPGDTINTCFDCTDGGDVSEVEDETVTPKEFKLEAYPNPFNSQVKLNVLVPADKNTGQITFKIYNILGQVVKTFESSLNSSGKYEFEWNGVNDYGELVSSGIYLFVVQTAEKNYTHKIVLMK